MTRFHMPLIASISSSTFLIAWLHSSRLMMFLRSMPQKSALELKILLILYLIRSIFISTGITFSTSSRPKIVKQTASKISIKYRHIFNLKIWYFYIYKNWHFSCDWPCRCIRTNETGETNQLDTGTYSSGRLHLTVQDKSYAIYWK